MTSELARPRAAPERPDPAARVRTTLHDMQGSVRASPDLRPASPVSQAAPFGPPPLRAQEDSTVPADHRVPHHRRASTASATNDEAAPTVPPAPIISVAARATGRRRAVGSPARVVPIVDAVHRSRPSRRIAPLPPTSIDLRHRCSRRSRHHPGPRPGRGCHHAAPPSPRAEAPHGQRIVRVQVDRQRLDSCSSGFVFESVRASRGPRRLRDYRCRSSSPSPTGVRASRLRVAFIARHRRPRARRRRDPVATPSAIVWASRRRSRPHRIFVIGADARIARRYRRCRRHQAPR